MKRTTAAALLAAHLVVLIDLTLFQFLQRDPSPNLMPFRTMARDLRNGGSELIVNFVGNVVAFVPIGFLLPTVWPGRWTAWRVALAAAALSGSIEAAQYATGRRVADVDDVTLNTAGALLGYAALFGRKGGLERRRAPGRRGECDPNCSS